LLKKLVTGILLASLAPLAVANDADNYYPQTGAAATDDDVLPPDRQQLRLRQDALEKMLADVEQHYGKTAAQLHSLQIKIEQKRRHLDSIHQAIQADERQMDREKRELATQIKAAYKMGRQEQLKLMFNQQDPALSGRMLLYYQHLNKVRLDKITRIEQAVAELEQLNKQDQDETAALEKTLQQKQAEQIALNGARKQRNELLAHIAKVSSPQQQLSYLQESENALRNLIADLPDLNVINDNDVTFSSEQNSTSPNEFSGATRNFAALKGKLPWPVKGRLAQKFGSPRSETVWDGVLIDAPEGVEIHAVAAGTVTFAEWLKSYGYLMIIEHDKDYMSLYAFNQSLFKHKNATVKAGEVIAAVGQSGGRARPGLYFGIRRRGAAIDPQQWCRK